MSGRTTDRALADESGFALASAVAILLIVLLVAAVGSAVAISSLGQTSRDRSSTNAFTVADSAIDITTWRMNRLLVSPEVQGLLGLTGGLTQLVGCVDVDAGAVKANISTNDLCQATVQTETGLEATCSTQAKLGVNLNDITTDLGTAATVAGERLLERDIACWATVDDVTRRVRARLGLRLTVSATGTDLGEVTSIWKRNGWVECTASEPSGSDPFEGCPEVPALG